MKRLNLEVEAGVLLGPNLTGEWLVTRGPCPEGGTWVDYASATDVEEAKRAIRLRGPRSIVELGLSRMITALSVT